MEPSDLVESLVAAFPIFVEHRLETLGVVADRGLTETITNAVAGLGDSLEMLATLPPQDQVKSPLELVREATLPFGEALLDRQVTVPERDEWAVAVHPEDLYELYPASSRDLGEDAWQLHLAWGISKARVVAGMVPASPPAAPATVDRGPTAALFGLDPLRRGELASELGARGYRSLLWRNPAALEKANSELLEVAFVYLGHPAAHDAIRTLAAQGTRVVAVTELVNDLEVAGMMALGAEDVVELDGVVDRLDRLLPRLV